MDNTMISTYENEKQGQRNITIISTNDNENKGKRDNTIF